MGIRATISRNLFSLTRQYFPCYRSLTFSRISTHCHDWQTGLIPVYLKTEFAGNPFFWGMKSVMTIHNLKFQGVWDIETIQGTSGLPMELFTPDKLEFKKGANMLKGGLVYADYITTVSDTYAGEIQTPSLLWRGLGRNFCQPDILTCAVSSMVLTMLCMIRQRMI